MKLILRGSMNGKLNIPTDILKDVKWHLNDMVNVSIDELDGKKRIVITREANDG
tara:strand:+ start:506 stop:667 length:162 start_codon:yes stop_codon:yes gene_type:complete